MRRTRAARVIATSIAVLSVAGCGSSDAKPPATTRAPDATAGWIGEIETVYEGEGARVLVLGDSIIVATRDELRDVLSDFAVKVAAITGEGLSGGAISREVGGGAMPEVAARLAEDQPEIVVVALGTNDAWRADLTLGAARTALQTITSSFEDACMVMVTISETSRAPDYDRSEASAVNEALRARADEVVEWGSLAGAESDRYLQPDEIHPTQAGQEALAGAIAEAVDACGV